MDTPPEDVVASGLTLTADNVKRIIKELSSIGKGANSGPAFARCDSQRTDALSSCADAPSRSLSKTSSYRSSAFWASSADASDSEPERAPSPLLAKGSPQQRPGEAAQQLLRARLQAAEAELQQERRVSAGLRARLACVRKLCKQQAEQADASASCIKMLQAQVQDLTARAVSLQQRCDNAMAAAAEADADANAELASLGARLRAQEAQCANAMEALAQAHEEALAEAQAHAEQLAALRQQALVADEEEAHELHMGRIADHVNDIRCRLLGMKHFAQLPTSGPGVKQMGRPANPLRPSVTLVQGSVAADPRGASGSGCAQAAAIATNGVAVKRWACAGASDVSGRPAGGVLHFEDAIREAVMTAALSSDPRVSGAVPALLQLGVGPCSDEARALGCTHEVVLVTPAGRGDVLDLMEADVERVSNMRAAGRGRRGLGKRGMAAALVRRMQHYTRGMVQSLAAIHSTGLLAEDAKPENCLSLPCGSICSIDLEALRWADGTCDSVGACAWGTTTGTPGHFAPERATSHHGGPYSSQFSDVYALGVSIERLVEAACEGLPDCALQIQAQVEGCGLGRVMRAMMQQQDACRPTAREALRMMMQGAEPAAAGGC